MKHIKKHKILLVALISYAILACFSLEEVLVALEGSRYYFLEMLQILPAVFILTSLIQTWVPQSTIMKYFGDGSGIKGYTLSFLIGSLSAGPIYAAFPVCKTLVKKGANLDNIIIILSAWAVVKVPMLINEAKFMGLKYMLIRWTLTVIAILIMARLFSIVVKKKDMVLSEDEKTIDHATCILCNACLRNYPTVFFKEDDRIKIYSDASLDDELKNSCPVGAIR